MTPSKGRQYYRDHTAIPDMCDKQIKILGLLPLQTREAAAVASYINPRPQRQAWAGSEVSESLQLRQPRLKSASNFKRVSISR